MLNFDDLQIKETSKVKDTSKVIIIDTEEYNNEPNIQLIKKIDFKKDILKEQPKLSKGDLRLIEPGYKDAVTNYLQVSQWCDNCEEVRPFAHKPEKRKMICLYCKNIRSY